MKIPLPTGVTSVHEWGCTLCGLDKYKSKQLSYAQTVSQADFDKEMYSYLCFEQVWDRKHWLLSS